MENQNNNQHQETLLDKPVNMMTPEEKDMVISAMRADLKDAKRELRTISGNMRWLRQLLEEAVGLTENAAGIVVEHTSTLDSRLGEIGTLFADKIAGDERVAKILNSDSNMDLDFKPE